jgi:D-alanine-D-alanine ligase
MDTSERDNFQGNVVLVADRVAPGPIASASARRDLEKSDRETVERLVAAVQQLGRTIVQYSGPQELAENAARHKKDVVLSIYGGESSRSRMALVPAICESFDLPFLGPDVYGRIIAQDKEISKRLALDCGMRTPPWRTIRRIEDINVLQTANFPCVVKPLLEGSSIGISQSNLVRSQGQAKAVVDALLADIGLPIMIENFIPGREVAYVAIQDKGESIWAYAEIVVEGRPGFFQETLFDAAEKIDPTPGRTVRNIDGELSEIDRKNIERFLSAFGHFGYCRVDGRHVDGKFHFLEMTPDAWIDPRGQFSMAYTEKGWTYNEVIAAVLASKG